MLMLEVGFAGAFSLLLAMCAKIPSASLGFWRSLNAMLLLEIVDDSLVPPAPSSDSLVKISLLYAHLAVLTY